jgi:tetratricopeptide (TPR) repeat protein
MRLPSLLLVLAAALALPSSAPAQAPTPRDDAREAFLEGSAAADEGRWTDAVDSFRRAYTLSASPVALFNVGFALRALGRYLEASRAFDELLAGTLDDETRAESERLRLEVRSRLAHLDLSGWPEGLDLELRVDARPRPVGRAPSVRFDLDPGDHSVSVRSAGHEPWEWAGALAAGETRALRVALLPVRLDPPSSSVWAEPWLWVVVGVVVAASAAVAGWAIDDAQQLRPEATVVSL